MKQILLSLFLAGSAAAHGQSAMPVSGCTTNNFVDGSMTNLIETAGTAYSQKCLRVPVGATVTIQASAHHPLSAMPDIQGAQNPFAGPASPQSVTKVMSAPGLYGYFCQAHGDSEGDGMAGLIWVE